MLLKSVIRVNMHIKELMMQTHCIADVERGAGMKSTDLISRQAAIDAISVYMNGYKEHIGKPDDSEVFAHSRGLILSIESSINALPSAEPGWISLKEKLPNDEQCVLLSFMGGVELVTWDDEIKRLYRNCKNIVAAWMPLPEPYHPKEGLE